MVSAVRLLPRPFTLLLALFVMLAPFAQNPLVTPAHAYGELDVILRVTPAILATVVGWNMGAPLGIVGKALGAFVGLQVGKLVGRFLARQIGGIFHDPYQYEPPLWKRLLGIGPSYGYRPWAPSSTNAPGSPVSTADLGALREKWIASVNAYQDALKSGSDAAKKATRDALEAAQAAYFSAKGAGAR